MLKLAASILNANLNNNKNFLWIPATKSFFESREYLFTSSSEEVHLWDLNLSDDLLTHQTQKSLLVFDAELSLSLSKDNSDAR